MSSPPTMTNRYARMVVKDTIYYESFGDFPTKVTIEPPPRSYFLRSEDKPWQISFDVGQDWTPLPLGWMEGKDVSMMLICNETGDAPIQVIPTQQQIEEVKSRVILVSTKVWCDTYDLLAEIHTHDPPLRLRPTKPQLFFLKCKTGKARAKVVLMPM